MKNQNWSSMNIKGLVLNDIKNEINKFEQSERVLNDMDKIASDKSIRYFFDELKKIDGQFSYLPKEVRKELLGKATKCFIKYRELKYGNEAFWKDALKERKIGYCGEFEQFLINILSEIDVNPKGPLLVLGCGNGDEIPSMDREIWALDLLEKSIEVAKINRPEVRFLCADFEELPKFPVLFSLAMCLRCITPNTRIDKLFENLDRVMDDTGGFLCSQPFMYLHNGKLQECDEAIVNRQFFESKIKEACSQFGFELLKTYKTEVEYFWLIKRIKIKK